MCKQCRAVAEDALYEERAIGALALHTTWLPGFLGSWWNTGRLVTERMNRFHTRHLLLKALARRYRVATIDLHTHRITAADRAWLSTADETRALRQHDGRFRRALAGDDVLVARGDLGCVTPDGRVIT